MSEEIANEQETAAVLQPEEVQVEATAAAEETNATETETTEAILENPFDFTVEPEPDDEVIEEVVDGGEYAPDFGSYFGGNAEVRGMITGHAKAAGIPAEAAGKFVAAVCKSLREDQLRVLGEGQRVWSEDARVQGGAAWSAEGWSDKEWGCGGFDDTCGVPGCVCAAGAAGRERCGGDTRGSRDGCAGRV